MAFWIKGIRYEHEDLEPPHLVKPFAWDERCEACRVAKAYIHEIDTCWHEQMRRRGWTPNSSSSL
jgi:hypothetical protein